MSERPSSRDFETYLVLSVIYDSRFRDYVCDVLQPEIFTEFDCRYIYETILRLRQKKKPVTFFSVHDTIRRDTQISDAKSIQICKILQPYAPVGSDTTAIESMKDGVLPEVEKLVRSRIVEVTLTQSMDLFESKKPEEIVTLWEKVSAQSVYQISSRISVWDKLDESEGDMKKALNYRLGIPSGICGLDSSRHLEYLDDRLFYKGLGRGHLGIVLADSNIGKSTFMLNMALHASLNGYNVEYYTLELDKEYLEARTVSIITGIPTDDIIKDSSSKKIKKKLAEAHERYPKRGGFHISNYTRDNLTFGLLSHDLTMADKEGQKTDMLIIDHMDLMRAKRQHRERRHEIGDIAISLRDLGSDYDCTVLSPSNMNRGTFQDRKKKTKDRNNMGEDFSKVYTCDYLWILTEIEEEVTREIGKGKEKREYIRFFVDKNRFGRRGMVYQLKPDKNTGLFYNVFPEAA